jgi:hypothetical protein
MSPAVNRSPVSGHRTLHQNGETAQLPSDDAKRWDEITAPPTADLHSSENKKAFGVWLLKKFQLWIAFLNQAADPVTTHTIK